MIQEESAEDMALVAGIVEAGVGLLLEERVAVWVA